MSKPLRPSTPPNPRVANANMEEVKERLGVGGRASNADKDIAAKNRNENPAMWLGQAHPDYACKVLDAAFLISTEGGSGDATVEAAERMLCRVFDLYGVPHDRSD